MSFFFQKQKNKLTVEPASTVRLTDKIKESLNRLGCKACPHNHAQNNTPKMAPILGKPNGVYFLGDYPSEADDNTGAPFSDKMGKILLEIAGKSPSYSYDNTIRDYSLDSKQGAVQTKPSFWQSMECCRQLVVGSIETAKPKIIIGFGLAPLQWMLKSSDMIGLRGRTFAVKIGKHPCWFMPTYHPKEILESAYDQKNPLRSRLGHCLKFDVKHALQVADTVTA